MAEKKDVKRRKPWKRIEKPSGSGKEEIGRIELRRRIDEGELPYVAPAPDMSLPVPATAKRPELSRFGKGAYHIDHEPFPYGGRSVDPGYLMRHTTGPIPTEDEVLRQLEEYGSVTGDPLMAFKRRMDEELAVLRAEHSKRMRRRTPLTSRRKK
jgi:hypothetical protein